MRVPLRSVLLAATVCAASGCNTLEPTPSWVLARIESDRTSKEYASFLTARYADMSGSPAEAAEYYRRAYQDSKDDPSALELATLATLVAGEIETGIQLALDAKPQVAEASATAQLALAIEDIADGRNGRALQRLKSADVGAINQDVQGFLVSWLTAQTDLPAGLAQIEQQTPRRALAGELASLKALVLLSAGKDKEALTAFDQASRLPVGAPSYLVMLRARLMASMGDTAGAHRVVELQMEEEEGATSESEYVLALLNAGKPIERPRVSVKQGAAIAMYIATAGRLARYNADLAAMRYSLALRLDPELAPARLSLSDSLNERGRTAEAIGHLRAISAGSPWYAEAKLTEAWGLNTLDRLAEALAAADASLAASRRREILLGAADLFRVNQNNSRAEALYSEIAKADLAANKPDWRVLFARATAREAAGNWKDAEADLLAALAVEPDRPEVQNFLGYGWVNRGIKVQEGIALIRKAVAARPDQGHIVDSLGWAHFALGEYEEAVYNLERAAELSPSDPEIVEHLGDAYWRAGRSQDAMFEWRRALQLKPEAPHEAALLTKVDRGLPALPAASVAVAGQSSVAKAAQ
jgi:tetratricopeptide (TPR) repeat protein